MSESPAIKKPLMDRVLNGIERACNKLPTPAILFIYLFVLIAVLSAVLSAIGLAVENPTTGELVKPQNFFSSGGLLWLLQDMVKNFTGFAPLGLVLTMTLAIGMCEESGLIITLLNDKLRRIPPIILPFAVAFVGVMGNLASDTAMVVIPPVAAILYMAAGKHPVVGMICGYAGAQGGFSANLMIAGTDGLLAGITNENIKTFLPDSTFVVDVSCNWYFMFVSTFMCSIVIGLVCNIIVDKRFGSYVPQEGSDKFTLKETTELDHRGMRLAGIAVLVYFACVVALFFMGPLAKIGPEGQRELVGSPLISNLIPILFFFFAIPGLVFGFVTKIFKSSTDVSKAMNKQMSNMGSYIVFCFFCGQFNALFGWTKLGTILAISGANALKAVGFTGMGMCVSFILLTAFINLFIPSGSAKWALLAPVFIPMLMLLGYHPGFTQLLYRLGDSPCNAFTPMSPYIWVTLSVAQTKYDKNLKIGTLAASLFPIAVVLQIVWIIMLLIWMSLGIEYGPGVGTYLPAGVL